MPKSSPSSTRKPSKLTVTPWQSRMRRLAESVMRSLLVRPDAGLKVGPGRGRLLSGVRPVRLGSPQAGDEPGAGGVDGADDAAREEHHGSDEQRSEEVLPR